MWPLTHPPSPKKIREDSPPGQQPGGARPNTAFTPGLACKVCPGPHAADDEWATAFERRIRDVASRAVAHLKRGDRVTIVATGVGSARADRTVGADPLLRYLALLEPASQHDAPAAEAAQ